MAIPLNVISGFLGSGKTTLLNRLLADPSLDSTLVLINEFGEVGLDHLLVGRLDETTVLLRSGCVCCTVRDDLMSSLGELLEKKQAGPLAHIDRVVLETTGLADPAPIAATLGPHSPLHGEFYYDGMIVTVDAMNWKESLEHHREARAQVAMADKLFITKLDLCPESREPLLEELKGLNPRASIFTAETEVPPLELLSTGLVRPSGHLDAGYWLAPVPEREQGHLLSSGSHSHSDVRSFVVVVEEALNLKQFAAWTSLFTVFNGNRVLRMKALICVEDQPGYLAFDAIRSFVHPPTVVPAAPGAPRHSTVVFILQDFSEEEEEVARSAVKSCAVSSPNPIYPI